MTCAFSRRLRRMQFTTPKRLTTTLLSATVFGLTACSPSNGATAPSAAPAEGERSVSAEAGTIGAAGIGDPDFPTDGNGGYDVAHYALKLSYAPKTHDLGGTANIQAKSVQNLSRFNLDLHG